MPKGLSLRDKLKAAGKTEDQIKTELSKAYDLLQRVPQARLETFNSERKV